MTRSIKRFRLLIICLALISFILGMVLNSNFEFPDKLPLMLISEALTVIFYSRFAYGSKKKPQNRVLRITLRVVLAFLMMFGPLQALRACEYNLRRDYEQESSGFHNFERIRCFNNGSVRSEKGEKAILPSFRLFRARCIITSTVCVLMVVETFIYGFSDEALGLPQHDGGASAETRNDVELGDTSVSEPQKMVLPDPPCHCLRSSMMAEEKIRFAGTRVDNLRS